MMKPLLILAAPILSMLALPMTAQADTGLEITALGVRGGVVDGDLTAFLIHPVGIPVR
jgi:hypothetical protein